MPVQTLLKAQGSSTVIEDLELLSALKRGTFGRPSRGMICAALSLKRSATCSPIQRLRIGPFRGHAEPGGSGKEPSFKGSRGHAGAPYAKKLEKPGSGCGYPRSKLDLNVHLIRFHALESVSLG